MSRTRPPTVAFPAPSLGELALLAVVFGVFVIAALTLVRQGSPLGHDESVYALRARQFVTDTTPISYWRPYRAPGLPLVLQVAWLGPTTEPYLRLVVSGFGIILIAGTWFIGRLLGGVRVGLIAAGGIAMTSTFLMSATQVWPDVPGAALGMLALALYAWSVSRERVSLWILFVPILAFASTLVRFGAPIPLAIGLITLTLWRRRSVTYSWRLVSLTAVLTLIAVASVLFIPAVTGWAQSVGDPTSPFSAISASKSASAFPWYQGLLDYWESSAFLLGGAAGIALVFGLISGVVIAAPHSDRRAEFWTALGTGIATAGAISLVLHGEVRYLSPALPWLWIAAAFGLAAVTRLWPREMSITVTATIFVLVALNSYAASGIQNDANGERHQVIKDAATAIDTATRDFACSVITGDTAIVGWYSKCPTNRYNTGTVVIDHPAFPDGPRFLFLIEGGERQPEDAVLDGYLEATTGVVVSVGEPNGGRRRYVEVYEVQQ